MKRLALLLLMVSGVVGWAQPIPTYYIQGLMRQGSAQYARSYLGLSLATTNGYVFPQVQFVPTNSIPASSPGVTNWIFCNVSNIGPVLLATNTAAGGYQKIKMNAPSAL